MSKSLTLVLLFLFITFIKSDTVVISPYKASPFNGGKFQGWGTSFCWWANRLGYSDVLAEKAATAFYNKEKGLGLNIVRYNIGGGDNPSHTHIKRTDSNIPGYWKNPSTNGGYKWDYDWDKDFNQRNALFKSIEACGDEIIVEAFSNSPPYFMTNSGCSTGAVNAGQNNLKDNAYQAFADYLADVSEHFKDAWGVNFESITPMNEPYTNYWGANSNKQEGCHFDQGRSMDTIIQNLRKSLDSRGLKDIIISASDETSIDTQIDSYKKLSSDTKKIVQRIDTHTYGGSNRGGLRSLAQSEGKNLWMSEVDGGNTAGQNAGEMGSALWFAERIITDMNGLLPSAWIMWQVIDNHISSKGMNGNKDSGMVNTKGGFWGLAVADHDKGEIILTMKYYAYGQFSRYIRPGYTIIGGDSKTLAAYDSKGKKLVIVAINLNGGEKAYEFDLSQFSKVGSSAEVIRTSGSMSSGEKWAKVDSVKLSGTSLKVNLKGNSITTFIIEGVESASSELKEIKLSTSMVTGSKPWNDDTNYSPQKVVDGNYNTYFDGVSEGYVIINLGATYKLDAIGYAPRPGYEYRMQGGEFFGSTDGKTWEKLATLTSEPPSGLNYVFANKFQGSATVSYIKYAVPSGKPNYSNRDEDSYCANIAEIKLYGEKA